MMHFPRSPAVTCLLVLLLLLSLGLPANAATRARTSTPSTLTIGVLSLPRTLNPLLDPRAFDPLLDALPPTADITDGVFDSLYSADTHNVLQPDLASGYTVSAGGTRYEFHLDPHAHWQDGVPVTAADVLFTAKLMRDPRFPAMNRFGFGNIATLASTGDLTVTVTLHSPYAPFLRAFATTPLLPAHVLGPIPIDTLAHYDTFNRRPLGDGPYAVTEFQDGDHITLTASASYFRGAPHIPTIVFRLEPSISAALAALHSGAIDMLGPSAGITPQQALAALTSGKLTAYASPGYGWTHIDLIESGFLRDHVVRQALAYATPRQRIVATLFDGLVTPADADQPPTSHYYEPQVNGAYPYNPARVPGLLRKRGYKRVKGHNMYAKFKQVLRITLWLDKDCADCRAVARVVAGSWTAAGIATALRAVPTHTLFGPTGPLYNPARLTSPTLNAVLYTWLTLPEPDDSIYWSTSMIVRPGHESGLNFDGYSNPRVDALTARALTSADEATRVKDYRAIQRLLVHDQPDVFLYWTSQLSVAVATLHGYEANPFQAGVTWNVANWRLG